MQITELHSWTMTPTEAAALQRLLAATIDTSLALRLEKIRFVAGVDCSSTRFSPVLSAGVVVWDRETGRVVETASVQEDQTFPYIPGLLSFREIPVLLKALDQLTHHPDVILVDGHGIAHPRRLGIAAHLGLFVDVPTVGVAKSRLCGTDADPGHSAGDRAPLVLNGETIGTILRTKAKANPLYVSPGNRCDQTSAVELVMQCLRGYRLPEPTRLAHEYIGEVRRSHSSYDHS